MKIKGKREPLKAGITIATFFLLMLPTTIVLCQEEAILYVDDNNTEGPWDGSLEHPYQTIQDAIDAVEDDQTIFVFSGNYYETIRIRDISITLVGEDRETTSIEATPEKSCAIIIRTCNKFSISGFTIYNARKGAFYFYSDVRNITIQDNIIRDCGEAPFSIHTNGSIVSGNIIKDNVGGGIQFVSSHNIVTNNFIEHNGWGLAFFGSNNLVVENTIKDSIYCSAIWMEGDDNRIYHNNFINSTIDTIYGEFLLHAINRGNNHWDNGYPSGGNYWDDYTGIDADGDGIGDIPYKSVPDPIFTPFTVVDHYPFMEPNGWLLSEN